MGDANVDRSLPTGFDSQFRGYAWLDSMDQIGKWTESSADPIQISNTPLMKRPDVQPSNPIIRSNIMLMTDSAHDGYDAAQVAASSIDRYTLEHWQSVEVFVYFGHRRAMIPPVSWVNAGHRNGALVLGTFCCEGDYDDNGHILDKRSNGTYMVADALARIAKCYGFDGWLINIETGDGPYRESLLANSGAEVAALIGQLRSNLPSGKIIWYDGIVNTSSPYDEYQNTLNGANIAFSHAAGSVVTNYWWDGNPKDYFDTAKAAAKDKMNLDAIYFGLECQGQRVPKFRQTYRGGTALGEGVKLLAANGFGSGLFSIAWAFEDFSPDNMPQQSPRVVDRFMWEGQSSLISDIEGLKCHCTDGGKTHLGTDNGVTFSQNPIARWAKHYLAGSEGLFHTDYSDAILHLAAGKYQAQIARQSISPVTHSPMTSLSGTIATRLSNSSLVPRCTISLEIAKGVNTSGQQLNESFNLHYLSAKTDYNLQLSVTYKRVAALAGLDISIFALIGNSETLTPANQKLLAADTNRNTVSFPITGSTGDRITCIGIAIKGPANLFTPGQSANILDIFHITVKPANPTYPQGQQPTNINLTRHTASTTYPGESPQKAVAYYKLTWTIPPAVMSPPANWPSYLPWSATTGPFAFFTVSVDGKELGQAHALVYVIGNTTFQGLGKGLKGPVQFVINGYAFDGSFIGSGTASVTAA